MRVRPLTTEGLSGERLSLTLGRAYEVLAVEGQMYRVLTDPESWPYGNDPVLYESALFEIVESSMPDFWAEEVYEDGEGVLSPPEWKGGFFEEFHERSIVSHKTFWNVIKKRYPWTWAQRVGS